MLLTGGIAKVKSRDCTSGLANILADEVLNLIVRKQLDLIHSRVSIPCSSMMTWDAVTVMPI